MVGYVPRAGRIETPRTRIHAGIMAELPPRSRIAIMGAGAAPAARGARRGLVLDLDDTLYPRERFVRSGLAAVAQHVEIEYGVAADAAYGVMTRALATRGNGSELQALCDRFGLPAAAIPALVEVFRAHSPTLFLGAGSVEALRRLRSQGWALAVLTNGLPSVQFRKIAALGLTPFVDEIVYAEEHAPGGKPSAAPFRAALRSLDLAPGQCICVGDDVARDVAGARAVGLATIRVSRPGMTAAPAEEADLVIDSLQQLPDAAALLLGKVTANAA